jgi:hypothetical protein
MAIGIVSTNKWLLHRLAFLLEGTFGDCADCVDVGEGPFEARPEFRRKYRRTMLQDHPDGTRRALILSTAANPGTGARTALTAIKAAILAKQLLGQATAEENAIAALPLETTLDASWEPPGG